MKRALILLALSFRVASAQPATVLYHGFLTDSGGDPVTATTGITFRLYPAPSGGTPLWEESVLGVDIQRGSFTVELSIDAADLVQDDLWLALVLDDELPRQRVGSVPLAMLCGESSTLGGLPPASYQSSVTGSCPPGEAISAIDSNGLVTCDPDAANVVTSVTPGDGLLGSTPLTGPVILEVALGPGLFFNVGAIDVLYGGAGGLDQASRSDHGHGGYLPLGSTIACPPNEQMTGFDSATGDVQCSPDVDNLYAPGPSGNLVLDASNNFNTALNLTIGGSLGADSFPLQSVASGYMTLHASDFSPAQILDHYQVTQNGGGYGSSEVPSIFNVYAPLPLPQGVSVTDISFSYENPDDASDDIGCFFHSTDLYGNSGPGSGTGGFGGGTVVITIAPFAVSPPVLIDHLNFTYEARCYLGDQGIATGDVRIYSVQVNYTYDQLRE